MSAPPVGPLSLGSVGGAFARPGEGLAATSSDGRSDQPVQAIERGHQDRHGDHEYEPLVTHRVPSSRCIVSPFHCVAEPRWLAAQVDLGGGLVTVPECRLYLADVRAEIQHPLVVSMHRIVHP